MNNGANGLAARELSLVKLYMELMQTSEFTARGVFMHVCCRESEGPAVSAVSNDNLESANRG